MSLNCGIVGLPNVGKSTLFSAITKSQAEAANYPFCTIEPNVGIVNVPDERINIIGKLVETKKEIPAIVQFVDIAGLVEGASKGEGLGNQFLGHIRQVSVIVHVLRCYENKDITHVKGKIDPISDFETINIELALKDLESVEKKIANLEKSLKSQNKEVSTLAKKSRPILEKIKKYLSDGNYELKKILDDEEKETISDLNLLTLKKQVICCNVDEDSLEGNNFTELVSEHFKESDYPITIVSAQIEKEISSLDSEEEKKEFMNEIGLVESGLNRLVQVAYKHLGLQTYFTAGEKETRAWTFKKGMKAPEAAGIIHTDFEKGFIKAEVMSYEDLLKFKTESKVKENGRLRLEGKDYIVQDGDIIHFRFNV